jgi:integrase
VGAKYAGRATDAFRQLSAVLPGTTPLAELDQAEITRIVGHYTARPPGKRSGRPLAVTSVKTVLSYFRATLELAEAELGWTAAPAWRRAFKISWSKLYTTAEARAMAFGSATFSAADLKHLYAAANERQRLYLLLALNTGATQSELATLLCEDVDLDDGYITRLRGKTRATSPTACCWKLWPQTRELLARHMAAPNRHGLALLTATGRPLVDPANHCDAVTLTWGKLRRACARDGSAVRPLGFKHLRKTGATWIRENGDEQRQQEYLGHARGSVAGRHYSGPATFARLHDLLDRYHQELTDAAVFG